MSKEKRKREFEVGDVYSDEISLRDVKNRIDTLSGLSYMVLNEGYTKNLSEEQVTLKRKELSDVSIIINDIEIEKKQIASEFKERLAQPLEDKAELLLAIKHKSEYRKGNLFHIDDQENGFMYIFDEDAECVESRPLKPTERQGKIKQLNQEKLG